MFIPGTFGRTPWQTVSYLRGEPRHHACYEVLSMSSRATKPTTEWRVDWCLSSPIFTSCTAAISETPFFLSQTRSCCSALRAPHLEWASVHISSVCSCSHLSHSCFWKELQRSGSSATPTSWRTVGDQPVCLNQWPGLSGKSQDFIFLLYTNILINYLKEDCKAARENERCQQSWGHNV